ncbi:MAG: peptidase MA family metallohydrolase [Dehalococcoidia bacterium]
MSGMLYTLTQRLLPWIGASPMQIPNVYLFSSKELLRMAASAAGGTLGWESGFYKGYGQFRGIYLSIVDPFMGEVARELTHEYVHFLVGEAAPGVDIPAWVNEGLATYLEFHSGVEFGTGLPAQREMFGSADMVKERLDAGTLIPLSRLVSQKEWNSQTDERLVGLQYSEAYMAVRYLLERFGQRAVGLLLQELKAEQTFEAAFQRVTGITLAQFEQDWLAWLRTWRDDVREQIRRYVSQVDALFTDINAIDDDRKKFIDTCGRCPYSQRIGPQTQFVERASSVESRARALSAPGLVEEFHSQLLAFVASYKRLLQKELDAYRLQNNTMIDEASAMIPEVNGRWDRVWRALYDIKFNWRLKE